MDHDRLVTDRLVTDRLVTDSMHGGWVYSDKAFVSKLYINLECNVLLRNIYKCLTTFVNVLVHL